VEQNIISQYYWIQSDIFIKKFQLQKSKNFRFWSKIRSFFEKNQNVLKNIFPENVLIDLKFGIKHLVYIDNYLFKQ